MSMQCQLLVRMYSVLSLCIVTISVVIHIIFDIFQGSKCIHTTYKYHQNSTKEFVIPPLYSLLHFALTLGLCKKIINKPSHGTDIHLAVTTVLHLDDLNLASLDKKAARIYIIQGTGY